MNKKREKNEEREDKRKTIQQSVKTARCLTCKSLRTQETGLAYSGCRSLGHISDCGDETRESPRAAKRSKLRRKIESGREEADLLMGHLIRLQFN